MDAVKVTTCVIMGRIIKYNSLVYMIFFCTWFSKSTALKVNVIRETRIILLCYILIYCLKEVTTIHHHICEYFPNDTLYSHFSSSDGSNIIIIENHTEYIQYNRTFNQALIVDEMKSLLLEKMLLLLSLFTLYPPLLVVFLGVKSEQVLEVIRKEYDSYEEPFSDYITSTDGIELIIEAGLSSLLLITIVSARLNIMNQFENKVKEIFNYKMTWVAGRRGHWLFEEWRCIIFTYFVHAYCDMLGSDAVFDIIHVQVPGE